MEIYRDGFLGHLYWGKEIRDYHHSYPMRFVDRAFSPNPYKEDRTFSLDTMPQEYPAYGHTDFRTPALDIQMPDGSHITDFRYLGHEILRGKPRLEGLPATYVEDDDEAETLIIQLKDTEYELYIDLYYTVYRAYPVISRSVRVKNYMKESLVLHQVDSFNIDFRDRDYRLLHLPGAWGREREMVVQDLTQGVFDIESRRGASSHQHNPFFALLKGDASEDHGQVYGFSYVYSGNFSAKVEVDSFRNTRVHMGLNPMTFSWTLEPGQHFQSPEAVLVFSDHGIGGMSRTYHDLYRKRLMRGQHRYKERPVLINNWEATYFDFNEEKLLKLAEKSSQAGIELFVLDDGWFGNRDSDHSSLGDWIVNREKLPGGLEGLAKEIKASNMEFGIWVEPEMVSVDSDLYRQHPDWCLHVENRRRSESRNQLILDYTRPEVRDHIIQMMSDIFASGHITYVKWDMNRHMTEAFSECLPISRKKETSHRYILGLYEVMETLVGIFPHILFESCSGGGGRFDPGMLYYMPQTWTSDDTDAMERLKIQYGTSIVYPVISMGSHVSDIPNHQVHRKTPLKTRTEVAMAGNMGYELDLTKLSADEIETIGQDVSDYKDIRHIVQFGDFYRLMNPFESNGASWMFISEDKKEVLVFYYKRLAYPQESFLQLPLKGLNPEALYQSQEGRCYGGDELMAMGYPLPMLEGDFQSIRVHLKRVD